MFNFVSGNQNLLHSGKTSRFAVWINVYSTYVTTVYKKNTSIIIWVSWYKKAAKITTDITEDVIRNYALQNELVDVKVCAVNDIWSGLKLVVPLSKR